MSNDAEPSRLRRRFLADFQGLHVTAQLQMSALLCQLEPADPIYQALFGIALEFVGLRVEAERHLLKAYPETTADRDELEWTLGRICRSQGRFDEAERWYRKACETAPQKALPWALLGMFLFEREQFRQACEVLELGLKAAENNLGGIYLNLGKCKLAMYDFEAARTCFEAAVATAPDDRAARRELDAIVDAIHIRDKFTPLVKMAVENAGHGGLGGANGQGGSAAAKSQRRHLRDILVDGFVRSAARQFVVSKLLRELDPKIPFWTGSFGIALFRIGRNSEALPYLLQVYPETAAEPYLIEVRLARAYEAMGRFEEADVWYRKAINSSPDTTVVWVNYGIFLAQRERLNEAHDILQQGLQAKGDVDEVYLNLGMCKRTLGDLDGAQRCFSSAIAITPNYPEAVCELEGVTMAIRIRDEFAAIVQDARKATTN